MKLTTLISVIIPVYNGEQYIEHCLNNVMNQTYKNLEIIVVNDGSIDKSAGIAGKFPVTLISHEQNRGLSAARNNGIDAAKGEYIHFMDVDDSINPDFYKNLIEAAAETGADIACSGLVNERKKYETQLFKKRKLYASAHERLKITYVGRRGYCVRYLFRVNFLKKHDLRFEEGRYIEDLLFSFRAVYYAGKMVVVPGTEYYYHNRKNSILTNNDKAHKEKVHQDWLHAGSAMLAFAKEHNFKIPGVNSGWLSYIWTKFVARHLQ
ncbi:MAG: glycosyltransferase [Proteiniphilum sp.]|jgi:glycosyltransferase involved in cell wall biosynthesis|nr:glycosyltransferase [Proteiniphilum sp.]